METAWYFRLFFPNIGWFIIDLLLLGIIQPKRMTSPGPSGFWSTVGMLFVFAGFALTWSVNYSISPAFWVGLGIIILGLTISSLSFAAMREHPEKNKVIVDWGIYKVSRHSHVLSSLICVLGVVVMGWKTASVTYIILWVLFVLYAITAHFGVLSEEKINVEKFGQEYTDYMKRVPRYFFR
jgi:protein-S-isoprenylcysteine O-methyltransferase Ste14